MPVVLASQGEFPPSTCRWISTLRRERAPRHASVPALQPGERRELATKFAGGVHDEVFAWVDPEDLLDEIREGNNVACWRNDRDRRTLGALHLHCSFSEGAGSVDWQVLLAAASGYDLLWWSEHDWRIACRDQVEAIGFEPGEPVDLDFAGTSADAQAGPSAEDAEHGLALHLAVPHAGPAPPWPRSRRQQRLTFSLASQLTLSMRVLVRTWTAGSILRAGGDFAPSRRETPHRVRVPVGRRSGGRRDQTDASRKAVPRAATGSWIPTLPFPTTRWSSGRTGWTTTCKDPFTLASRGRARPCSWTTCRSATNVRRRAAPSAGIVDAGLPERRASLRGRGLVLEAAPQSVRRAPRPVRL